MHPEAVLGAPGKCPACGMPLRRAEGDEGAEVALSTEQLRLGGLTFATVERRRVERELTALATLELDERRIARVATPVRGTVTGVQVAAPGTLVRRGQTLATVSSRELAQLGKELQRSLPEEDVSIILARQRLLQAGLSQAQVDRLRRGREPATFELLSPLDGVLLAKSAVTGDQVPELSPLFTVADLSRLWLVVRLPEEEALLVGPGATIEVELVSAPARALRARVAWVDAAVDAQTRALAVRAELENPDFTLRPGMTGRARLRVPLGGTETPLLVVPATAVVDTGLRQLVWRQDDEGLLEAAEVRVAARSSEHVLVASGLEEGDRVVAQGAFLLSADLRLRRATAPIAPRGSPSSVQGAAR